MTTERKQFEVRGIRIEIVRKDIKNLHVGVYPPDGRVRVAAPLHIDDQAVRLAVISRLGWIRRQQAGFEGQNRQSEREMATGESHYFRGSRYRLDVVETDGRMGVTVPNRRTIQLRVRPGTGRAKRQALVDGWLRLWMRDRIPELIAKWEPVVGVKVAECRIKRMKTRWGTCNAEAGRIWLNLELAKKSPSCLEYILVHEMVHLVERRHDDRFRHLMDGAMPQWRLFRDELNKAPLSHEEWTY